MTFKQKLLTAAFGILIPFSVAAATPSNVTHVEAKLEGGVLTVSWSGPQPGDAVDFYRVYVSHESILDHDGNYDDSVKTPNSETTYVFPELPLKSPKIYIAVLAVNKDGVESEGFESEASVEVAPPASASSSEAPTAVPMAISEVRAVSATGVLITFTKPLLINVQPEPGFFALTDASGAIVDVTFAEVHDATILLHTGRLEPDRQYFLAILQPIPANDGTNLPTLATKLSFPGFKDQTMPPQESSSSAMSSSADAPYVPNPDLGQPPPPAIVNPPEDPVNLALKAMRRADGTYTVVASWGASADSAHTLSSYVVYTTQNGQEFNQNLLLAANKTMAKYDAIPAGVFGVKIASRDEQGHESVGIQKVITLPQSGIGLMGIATLSGLMTGRRMRRKK